MHLCFHPKGEEINIFHYSKIYKDQICPICFLFSGSAFPGQRIAVNISVQHGLLRLKNLNGVLFIAGEVSSFYIGFLKTLKQKNSPAPGNIQHRSAVFVICWTH